MIVRKCCTILLAGLLSGCGGAAASAPTTVPPTALPPGQIVATLAPGAVGSGPAVDAIVVNTFPRDQRFGDNLRFETVVDRPELVREVQFAIVDGRGQRVHARVERQPRFCVFGGGERGADCPSWNFARNGGRWPDGARAQSGATYTLISLVVLQSGQTVRQEHRFTLELP